MRYVSPSRGEKKKIAIFFFQIKPSLKRGGQVNVPRAPQPMTTTYAEPISRHPLRRSANENAR